MLKHPYVNVRTWVTDTVGNLNQRLMPHIHYIKSLWTLSSP